MGAKKARGARNPDLEQDGEANLGSSAAVQRSEIGPRSPLLPIWGVRAPMWRPTARRSVTRCSADIRGRRRRPRGLRHTCGLGWLRRYLLSRPGELLPSRGRTCKCWAVGLASQWQCIFAVCESSALWGSCDSRVRSWGLFVCFDS
jgi:hypothetical protein